jgi:hypothetical protein
MDMARIVIRLMIRKMDKYTNNKVDDSLLHGI